MLESFLAGAGWAGAVRTPLAGDASSRRYLRLDREGGSAVLMLSPPSSARDIRRFAYLADHLLRLGLSAPAVLAADPDAGFLLLEDLGNSLYPAEIAAHPALEPQLYRSAIDCLFHLQAAPPPQGLTAFTADEMSRQATLPLTSYAGQPAGTPCPYEAPLREALEAMTSHDPVPILRDYHAGNLFWLPDRSGLARVGLIDFQDARLAAPLYDVVSLLWDARRDLDARLRADLLAHAADRLGAPLCDVRADAATLSLQRNLRILGVFARLAAEDGKPGYLAHLPRVWRYVEEALSAPHLAALRAPIRDSLPPPAKVRTGASATHAS